MSSVEESIYQLLVDQIDKLGLEQFYDVQKTHIVGKPGTPAEGAIFSFAGLRHNADELKSYEGYNLCLVEEAKNVSRASWDILINTIRKKGSEIWVVFNPELESDETYVRFILADLPEDEAIVVHFTWRDNPWPSDVLAPERERMKLQRPEDYNNIWEGRPRSSIVGAIYAEEMMAAEREGRICRVPYDPSRPVDTFWDIGYGNHTSIWLGQKVGVEWRMIRFLEDSNKFMPHYAKELAKFDYLWGTDFLPHDGGSTDVRGPAPDKQLREAGRKNVEVVTRSDTDIGINEARAIFPFVLFDREGCADGIQCLRHYQWKKNKDGVVTSREPLHDEYSDGADAFRTFAMARNFNHKRKARSTNTARRQAGAPPAVTSWMAG